MATATVETKVANPARKRSGHMTAKQIKFFGTKRQRAALKAKRKSSHRPRSKPRKVAKRANPKHKRAAKRRTKANKPARKRNLGAIYALTANPAKGGRKSMAKTKRKSSNPKHRRAGSAKKRHNPARRHHSRRHNPGGMGTPKDWLEGGVGVIAGVVGTRAIPQLLLGSSNTGIMGYAANAASTALLTFAAHFVSKSKVLAGAVLAGGAASILSRIIQDYSLLGSYSSQVGLGDYLMSDFLTPQTLTNGLTSAQLGKPSWAAQAQMPVSVQGAGAGMSGIYGVPLY